MGEAGSTATLECGLSAIALGLLDFFDMARFTPILAAPTLLVLATFGDMKGVVETSSIHTGTPAAVILNQYHLHLISVVLELRGVLFIANYHARTTQFKYNINCDMIKVG